MADGDPLRACNAMVSLLALAHDRGCEAAAVALTEQMARAEPIVHHSAIFEINVESDAQESPPPVHHASQKGVSDSKGDSDTPEPWIVRYNMPPTDAQ